MFQPDETSSKVDILAPLIQCFVPILFGYISGKTGLISSKESKGLHVFIQYFSLPALIFSSIVTIKIEGIKWSFLACIVLAKVLVFISVSALTMILTNPIHIGKAGLYAIFATQSNDFALGYPLFKSLYSHHHTDYPDYLYLMAPIQLLIVNPVGLTLLEIHMLEENGGRKMICSIIKRIISNPIIFSTITGILGNYAFHHQLPQILSQLLNVLGSAFSATALFVLGLTLSEDKKRCSFMTVALLVAAKLLIMPLLIQTMVTHLMYGESQKDTQNLGSFGFLYGILPCAPTPFIFAKYYNTGTDTIAGGIVASTLLSVPLIVSSTSAISISSYGDENLYKHLRQTITYTSVISLFCCVWLMVLFIVGRKWKTITHGTTLCLILSQLFTSIGGMLWLVDSNAKWTSYIQFVFSMGGIFASLIWTAILAILLAILYQRSLCFVLRIRFIVGLLGFGLSLVLVISLITGLLGQIPENAKQDPTFPLGRIQTLVTFIVLLITFISTAVSLIIQQRFQGRQNEYFPLNANNGENESTENNCSVLIECKCNCEFSCTSPKCYGRKFLTPDMEDIGSSLCVSNDLCSQESLSNTEKNKFCTHGNSTSQFNSIEIPGTSRFIKKDIETQNKNKYTLCPKDFYSEEEEEYSVFCASNFQCSREQRKHCENLVHHYEAKTELNENIVEDKNQIVSHVVLLLLMTLHMLVSLAVCFWKLTIESTGIYIELEFLDVIMNYGQGIFTFAVFGIDTELVVAPIKRLWQKIRYGTGLLSLPITSDLSLDTKHICEQFLTYHYEKCVKVLAQEIHTGTQKYEQSFHGRSLVDWLLAVGLAQDRNDAQGYGNNLLLGRIIEDVNHRTFFEDSLQVYRFISV